MGKKSLYALLSVFFIVGALPWFEFAPTVRLTVPWGGLILGSVLMWAAVAGALYQWGWERKAWNKGVSQCGTRWACFDTTFGGDRGYKCSCSGNHTVWISYPVDERT